jgi:hypothetical protein
MPQLTIPKDIYERLSRRAAALNVPVEHLVATALESAAGGEAVNEARPTPPGKLPHDQWKALFDEFVAAARSRANRYPPGFQADVSRESMYQGCGE